MISQSNIFPGRNRRISILKRVTFPGKGKETREKKKGMWESRRERKERRGGEVKKRERNKPGLQPPEFESHTRSCRR